MNLELIKYQVQLDLSTVILKRLSLLVSEVHLDQPAAVLARNYSLGYAECKIIGVVQHSPSKLTSADIVESINATITDRALLSGFTQALQNYTVH